MQIILHYRDGFRLSPGVTEYKDVIYCNPEDKKNDKLIQLGVHVNLQDAPVDQLSQWEGQQDDAHTENCQEETSQVKPDVN